MFASGTFASSCDTETGLDAAEVALPVLITQAVRGLGVLSGAGVAFALATGGVIALDLAKDFLQDRDTRAHHDQAAEIMMESGFIVPEGPLMEHGSFTAWTSMSIDLTDGCLAMTSASQLIMFEAKAMTALGRTAFTLAKSGQGVEGIFEQMMPVEPFLDDKMNIRLSPDSPDAFYKAPAGDVRVGLQGSSDNTVSVELPSGAKFHTDVPF